MTLSAGSRLGPYEILGQIGAGGMGEVYRARDKKLDRDVAIKVLPQSVAADPETLARFEREAKAVAALSHPNILAIFDFGTHDEVAYAVTELLEGETLRGRLDTGPISQKKAVDCAVQIAKGLSAAHERGVVHRDLKPENLFVSKDGHLKILDFGLAKRVEAVAPGQETSAPTVSGHTEPGTVMGTMGYMSPEQVRGLPVDHRSDIFSLGAILYELLSGKRAFKRDTAVETMTAILRDEPPELSESGRNIPPALDHIVRHCLEKDQDNRFQSARDLAFDLETLSDITGPARTGKAAPAARPRRTRHLLLLAGVVAVSLALAASITWLRSSGKSIDSIAVLPFVNGSRDPNAEYLSDGITESIINSLSRLTHLRVTARSTVFRYKGRDEDPQKVGRDLNVRTVVSGKLIQRGDTLSIQADLVDVGSGSQIWGDHYERKLADILSVQEEIARGISDKLRLRLTGKEKQRLTKRYTENTESYQLYLKGRYAWEKRSESSLPESIKYFQQAIEKDPAYALAYAGLADSYGTLASYSIMSPGESFPRARAAARKALEIDDSLAQAHATLGVSFAEYDHDWFSAESEYKKAIALDGNYATAHHWYGVLLTVLGRFDEALAELRRARELDPFSAIIQTNICQLFVMARQYDRAIEEGRKVVEMDPSFGSVHSHLARAYVLKRMTREAIAEYEASASGQGRTPWGLAALGRVQALAGRRSEALQTIEELKALATRRYVSPAFVATVFQLLGDKDQAFEWWAKACEDHSYQVTFLKVDPLNDGLRDDPRFADLLRKAGLAP